MSMLDDTWAIVAIRSFAGGKSRLANELSVSQRRTLTMTMLDDVLLPVHWNIVWPPFAHFIHQHMADFVFRSARANFPL